MGALQVFVLVFFTLTYAVSIGKHGTPRDTKHGNVGALALGFAFVWFLYYKGGFCATFGWPQMALLFTDAVSVGIFSWKSEKKTPILHNGYLSALDYVWTFGLLWLGGFFTHGVPIAL